MQTQASSAKFLDTSVLRSTTVEAKAVLAEPALFSLLNVMSIVDVSCPSALFVCSNFIKNVAADATINKVADHASVTTDIARVVEDIVHKDGNKAVESDIIAYITKEAVDEAVGQSGVKNDDGHAAGEEIVATGDENVVEQVLHTTTLR